MCYLWSVDSVECVVQLMKRRGDRKLIKRWIKITYILGDSFTIDSQFDVVKSTVTHLPKSTWQGFLIRASSHTNRFVGNRADRAKMIVTALAHWYTRSKLGYTRVIYIHCTLLQTGDEFLSWVYHTLVNIAIFHNSVQLCEFYFVLLYLYVKCEPRNVNKQDFNNAVFSSP